MNVKWLCGELSLYATKEAGRRSLDDNVGIRRGRRLTAAAALLAGLSAAGLTAGCGAAPAAIGAAASGPAGTASAVGQGAAAGGAGATARTLAASPPPGTITEDGSTLLEPLMEKWAGAYHQQYPGVTVKVAPGGSTKGINDASSGAVDLGTSDAYLSSGDLLKNSSLLNIPLAVSAQSVLYNLPGLAAGTHVRLNGVVLAKMYSGAITTWNDPAIEGLNPGVQIPPVKVAPLHRSTGAGDTFLFTSYLSTQDPAWSKSVGYGTLVAWPAVATAQAASSSTAMYQACAQTAGCVAYNGVSYLGQEQNLGLGEAALQNSDGGYTLPDPASILAELNEFVGITPPTETISMIAGPGAAGYPIINYEYAIVTVRRPGSAKASQLRAFLDWVVGNPAAAGLTSSVGFQPLPAEIQTLSMQQIGEIR
jgi:phosphate transport system substrate-binding protein